MLKLIGTITFLAIPFITLPTQAQLPVEERVHGYQDARTICEGTVIRHNTVCQGSVGNYPIWSVVSQDGKIISIVDYRDRETFIVTWQNTTGNQVFSTSMTIMESGEIINYSATSDGEPVDGIPNRFIHEYLETFTQDFQYINDSIQGSYY